MTNSREVTLLPLQGENDLTRLTRGDADALPRAKCFWAFSPKNIALLSKCTKLCLDLQVELRENCFERIAERHPTPRRGKILVLRCLE